MKTTLAFLAAIALAASSAIAKAPEILDNLDQTLSAAAQEQKLTFVLMGRSTCSICNDTREGIRSGKIMVTAAHFVMADINVDDPKVHTEFMQKFKGQNFGNTLPFVVITDSSGKLLASSGGYKSPEQWNVLLSDAVQRAVPPGSAR
jgi:thioredoxin-related protein